MSDDNSLIFICAILAVALAFVGMILPEPNNGINGTDGINGSQGEQGIQGIQGIIGYNGSQGIQGIQGVMGYNGSQGEQGIQGINGTDAPSITLMNGIICYLPLNDGIGNASDYSGYMNHGIIYSASWIDGKFGKALSFDGSNDWVQIFDSSSLNPDYITIVGWVKIPVDVTGYGRLVFKGWTNQFGLSVGDAGAGRIRWIVARSSDGSYVLLDSPLGYNDNIYHFVVVSWNGSVVSLEIDNSVVASTSFSGVLKTSTYDIGLGAQPSGSECLKVTVDDFRIYERDLSQTEKTMLFNLP